MTDLAWEWEKSTFAIRLDEIRDDVDPGQGKPVEAHKARGLPATAAEVEAAHAPLLV